MSYLTRAPSPFFLLLTRPCTMHCRSFFLLAFLLLSGDVELNPGPTSFTVCTLNIRSILHPLHSAAISDFIDSHSPDLFCLTEPWIKPTTTFTELAHCTPCSVSLELPPKTRLLRLSAWHWFSYPWAFHTATHLTYWILLLRIVFCNSETTSLKNNGIQYLSSSFVFHLLQTFFPFFLMNLILSFLLPLPHLMDSSSPATLTSTLIITQTTLPLSFSLFCHRLT